MLLLFLAAVTAFLAGEGSRRVERHPDRAVSQRLSVGASGEASRSRQSGGTAAANVFGELQNGRASREGAQSPRGAAEQDGRERRLAEEYRFWFEDNRKEHVILAVRVGNNTAFSQEGEIRRMQEDTAMHSGNIKVKMSSYFPPTASDPYIHFAFPRSVIQPQEKFLDFEVYLPGTASPFRTVLFTVGDLAVDAEAGLLKPVCRAAAKRTCKR